MRTGRPRRVSESVATEYVAFRLTPAELGALDKRIGQGNDELKALGFPAMLNRASFLRNLVMADLSNSGLLPGNTTMSRAATVVETAAATTPAAAAEKPGRKKGKNAWHDIKDGFLPEDRVQKPARKSPPAKKSKKRPRVRGSR